MRPNLFKALALTSLVLGGCTSSGTKTPPKQSEPRPSVETRKPSAGELLNRAQELGNAGKTQEALQILAPLTSGDFKNDALMMQGFFHLKEGQASRASDSFKKIPEEDRQLMAEACMEFSNLKGKIANELLIATAKTWFLDCVPELEPDSKPQQVISLKLSREEILKLGNLYEELMNRTEDDDLRRRMELQFLQEHNLTEAQLTELTARYLEISAED